MGKFLFWLVWILEVIGFVISGACVLLYVTIERNIGLILLFVACGVLMIFGLRKAYTGYRDQSEPSKLAYYLALPLIAAFIGFGTCFTVL